MKYAVEMGSGAVIYIPSFRHSEKGESQTHKTAWRSHKPTEYE
jgi:hypothetical protein